MMLFWLAASPALLRAPPMTRSAAPSMLLREGIGAPSITGNRFSRFGRGGRGGPVSPDSEILVQGQSLRTWSYQNRFVEQVQVFLTTEGRPLDCDVELWNGPDNTPMKCRVYVDDGELRPFSAVFKTPRGPNTIAVKNRAELEFPLAAVVIANEVDVPSPECLETGLTIQGGALRTFPMDQPFDSVQVLLETDGRPLNARIELLQGPNNNKQVIEVYTEDGLDRPFFCILETPGEGNVVRIVNTAPVEFPMTASVVPHYGSGFRFGSGYGGFGRAIPGYGRYGGYDRSFGGYGGFGGPDRYGGYY